MRPTPVPIRTLDLSPPGVEKTLVVFLPGRRDSPEDFRRHRFAEIARAAGVRADFVAVDAHTGYYFKKTILERLREDVLVPARRRYERVWLVGISIGGTGSLLYADAHPEDMDGMVLLAPFLGTDLVIEEVGKGGGLKTWVPPPPDGSDDFERRMWSFLQRNERQGEGAIPVYLGWGEKDRFAEANALLGRGLPAGRTFTAPGGHDWEAWTALWRQVVAEVRF
jgi:pimeloyl-ACP methyl ester carboxylesterase